VKARGASYLCLPFFGRAGVLGTHSAKPARPAFAFEWRAQYGVGDKSIDAKFHE
jgi:hypothetical protein